MTSPLPLQAVHHISHLTTDLEASRSFYEDVLGFRPIPRPNFTFDGAWLFAYGVQIHLIVKGQAAAEHTPELSTRADHIAFLVDDIDQARNILQERDIPFRESQVPQTGVTQLFFQDPDGNHLELGCYPPVAESGESIADS